MDFDMQKYLAKLMLIDPQQTTDYIVQRYGRIQQVKIVDNCVQILNSSKTEQREYALFLFLDVLFKKNKKISKEFHQQQVELYIKYSKEKLMFFLQNTDAYSTQKACDLCKEHGLYKE